MSCQEAVMFLKEIFTAQMIMLSLNSHLSYFFNENLLQFNNLDWFYAQRKAGRIVSVGKFALVCLSADALAMAFY